MGDSDEEYESGSRKRHNKFRKERDDNNDYEQQQQQQQHHHHHYSSNSMSSSSGYGMSSGNGGSSSLGSSSSSSSKRRDHRDNDRGGSNSSNDYNKNNSRTSSSLKSTVSRNYPQQQYHHMPSSDHHFRRSGSPPSNHNKGSDRYDYYGRGGDEQSFKRSSNAPNYGYGGYDRPNVDAPPLPPPGSFYDDYPPHKKTRREWSGFDDPTAARGASYYEHDVRGAAPDYDEFNEEYEVDYNRLNRPPTNYPSSKGGDMAPSGYYRNQFGQSGYHPPDMPMAPNNRYSSYGYPSGGGMPMMNNMMAPGGPGSFPNNYNNNNMNQFGFKNPQYPPNFNPAIQNNNMMNMNMNMIQNSNNNNNNNSMGGPDSDDTQPQMMSFKQFLAKLTNETKDGSSITADIATLKYTDYKNNFRREQIIKFFAAHKHEDWFKCRYHPEISTRRKEEQRETIKRRLNIYMSLLDKYGKDEEKPLSLDMSSEENCTQLYKFLDAATIKLEDGTDEDLALLDELYADLANSEINADQTSASTANEKSSLLNETDVERNGHDHSKTIKSNDDKESGVGSDDETKESTGESTTAQKAKSSTADAVVETTTKAEKNESDEKVNGEAEAEVVISELDKSLELNEKSKEEDEEENNKTKTTENEETKQSTTAETASKPSSLPTQRVFLINKLQQHIQNLSKKSSTNPYKTQSIFFKHLPVIVTRQDLEEIGKKHEGYKRASISEPAPERRFQRRGWLTFDSKININEMCRKINGTKLYDMLLNAALNRELDQKIKCITGLTNYKTIVRNDLKAIIKVVENMDKRWGLWENSAGYDSIRIEAEKKAENVEEKAQEGEAETGSADNKQKADESGAMDQEQSESETNGTQQTNGTKSVVEEEKEMSITTSPYAGLLNPLIREAIEYLESIKETPTIEEEASANKTTDAETAETETEKSSESPNESNSKKDENVTQKPTTAAETQLKSSASLTFKMEKDAKAARLLDRLILYLRLVHSFDYYNATEYPQEDYMPNRCGALHVRGSIDSKNNNLIVNVINSINVNNYDKDAIKKSQIDEWIRLFETNIRGYVDYHERIDEELAKKLGLKELKAEIEKFITANCQKIEKDVWLCPLSGKKFKGPDYVRKHIESKHQDKLAELAKEVDYFNRFVYDPKRPYLPEHPINRNQNMNNNNNMMNQMMGSRSDYYSNQNYNRGMNNHHHSYGNNMGYQGNYHQDYSSYPNYGNMNNYGQPYGFDPMQSGSNNYMQSGGYNNNNNRYNQAPVSQNRFSRRY